MKIGISSCLLGNNVRYDGSNKKDDRLIELLENHELIPICPEMMAGFDIPHDPLEIRDNHVYTIKGIDVSDKLINGSKNCFELIKDCDFLVLKSKSPSCGYKKIYDGSFEGLLIDGNGIFTSICLNNNLKIFTENDYQEIKEYISQ